MRRRLVAMWTARRSSVKSDGSVATARAGENCAASVPGPARRSTASHHMATMPTSPPSPGATRPSQREARLSARVEELRACAT